MWCNSTISVGLWDGTVNIVVKCLSGTVGHSSTLGSPFGVHPRASIFPDAKASPTGSGHCLDIKKSSAEGPMHTLTMA